MVVAIDIWAPPVVRRDAEHLNFVISRPFGVTLGASRNLCKDEISIVLAPLDRTPPISRTWFPAAAHLRTSTGTQRLAKTKLTESVRTRLRMIACFAAADDTYVFSRCVYVT